MRPPTLLQPRLRSTGLAILTVLLTVLALGTGVDRSEAARDESAPVGGERRLEILVLEISDCNICGLVRQNIQPIYERTPRARSVPMRFVDVSRMDETKLGLNARIETVPTTVLLVDGREVDRIAGYLAPASFLHLITRMIDNAE